MPTPFTYFPATYTPYQPTIQTQQPAQTPGNILWVRSEQEAAMYPVAPNNAVPLWDSTAPVLYLKQADAAGRPTMKIYDLVERAQEPQNAVSAESGKSSTYATKDELAALAGVVREVDSTIASMRDEIAALKDKKTNRKKDDE